MLSGTARVVCNGRRIATVRTGDAVGEMSLIDGHRTSASVVAETAVDALELYRTAFQELLDDTPAISKKLLLAQTALEPRRYHERPALPVSKLPASVHEGTDATVVAERDESIVESLANAGCLEQRQGIVAVADELGCAYASDTKEFAAASSRSDPVPGSPVSTTTAS